MSVIDVWISGDHALFCTDTIGVGVDGERHGACKHVHLPLTNSILACRGHALFFSISVAAVLWSSTFDDAVDRLLDIARSSFGQFVEMAPTYGISIESAKASQQELVMVGWSSRLRRIQCVAAEKVRGAEGFTLSDCPRDYLAPWDESLASLPAPDTPGAMLRLAKAQVDLMNRNGFAAGGELKFAKVGRGFVQCWG